MPGGRPTKKVNFNLHKHNQASLDEDQPSTSANVQHERPARAAKLRCIKKLTEDVSALNVVESNRKRSQIQQINSQRRENENREERTQRLESLRQTATRRRSLETEELQRKRLRTIQHNAAQRRTHETADEHSKRLLGMQKRAIARRNHETPNEHNARLLSMQTRAVERRANETAEQHNARLFSMQNRAVERRAHETAEQHNARLLSMQNRAVERRANETAEQHNARLLAMQTRAVERRANETAEQHCHRLLDMRQHAIERRAVETSGQHEQRLQEQQRRNAKRLRNLQQNKPPTYKQAISYNVTYHHLEAFTVQCIHCGALHFPEERVRNQIDNNSFSDCCLHGRAVIDIPEFPNELVRLFLRLHPLAEEFHKRIRNLNACFALASFNVAHDKTISKHGIYSFIAGGQVYHKMNMAAHPTQNAQGEIERPQYGQLYFLDCNDAILERLQHPLNHGISEQLMQLLEKIVRSQNHFAQGFMMMREVENQVNQHAAQQRIEPPRVGLVFTVREGTDPNRFNVPQCNDVCAVLTLNADQSFPDNEMVVHQRGKDIITLKNSDNRIEPFTYPLFYPKGTFGYSINVQLQTPYASRNHITRLEFARYRIAFRPELCKPLLREVSSLNPDLHVIKFNALHFGGRLFQQYLVDTYIRVERDRIQWIKSNQKKILAEQYTGVTHFINELAEQKQAAIGEKIILPSSFPGSTRYYTEQFEDAMAIVRQLGTPDFFITITCNPNWPEIKEATKIQLEDGTTLQQVAQDRPDLIARVSKLKFDKIVQELSKDQIFGKCAAYVYTIEFQKRGLPHMHLLIIMSPEDKIRNAEELDDLVSAEIPDQDDPELRERVDKFMIHNPCGDENPNASCMVKKGGHMKCRFKYPKTFQDLTSLTEDETPNYRRRYIPEFDESAVEFNHEQAIYRKGVNSRRVTRDNRHVVPYNPYLLKKYNCHINVEYVGTTKAVKYIYKYIYKGHDCASIKIIGDEKQIIYNEPDAFIEGRCITPPEASWRLFGNEIQKKSHTVQRLDIHLPGQYQMLNDNQQQEDLADIGQKGSMLEAYFRHNTKVKQANIHRSLGGNSEEVEHTFYWKMPATYRWVGKSSEWIPRAKQLPVIGRVHNVSFIAQPELFHLRLLLFHVNNATCFEDLLTVDGTKYTTYKQACLARKLTYDDRQWIESLRESAMSKMPRSMRTLFVQILIFGSPENPKHLWETFKEDLAYDFIREARESGHSVEEAIKHAYRIIAHKLNTEATEGRNFQYWVRQFNMDNIDGYEHDLSQTSLDMAEALALGEAMYSQLNEEQLRIVETILHAINDATPRPKCFFIDGPGGTGKTFTYKTLYYIVRGKNMKIRCMAFTGIASILLPAGRTTHKTFGLKVPLTPESLSSFKPGSAKANELASIDVFLMDEAPMLPKYGLQTMDTLLREIANPTLPFGGKVVVLGGDFRQCLPVQPRANKSELIDLSIKNSTLWKHFTFCSLTTNMRVEFDEQDFAAYILQVGNGDLPTNNRDEIMLPEDIRSNGNLINEVFGCCLSNNNYEGMKTRAILAPLNKDVNKINADIITQLPGSSKLYQSYDSIKDPQEGTPHLTPEFLNSIELADLPPHKLELKKNTIIMLLRNLDISEGLCNGTRLLVTELGNNIIKAKIITGEHSGREVHIPRITLDSSKCQLGCTMQRHQFPVKAAFAMTIHKSQGQTFDFVGVDLQSSVFMHGMLYVALSRVKKRNHLKVLLQADNPNRTRNIVWKEILHMTANENL